MAHLSVVAIICKIHFGSDQQNLAVQADDSAVVSDISMLDGHCTDQFHIAQNHILDAFSLPISNKISLQDSSVKIFSSISQHARNRSCSLFD